MARTRALLALAVISALCTGTAALLTHPFNPNRLCCDHLVYRSMSYNLFTVTRPDLNVAPENNVMFSDPEFARVVGYVERNGFNRTPPYIYRVLTPLLARLIAFAVDINVAYYLISLFALAGTAFLIGLTIFELSGSIVPAMAGVFLFTANPWTVKFHLFRYMMVDPMMFFFVALAIWAIVKRNRWLFFATCAVGALNKEVLIPMLISYPLSEWLLDRRVRRSSVVATVVIAVGYFVFRVVMPENPGYSIFNLLWPGVDYFRLMAIAGIDAFGLLLVPALSRPWGSRLIAALVPFVIACVLEAWFVDNLEHAMVAAFPAVCVAVLWHWPPGLLRRSLVLDRKSVV